MARSVLLSIDNEDVGADSQEKEEGGDDIEDGLEGKDGGVSNDCY